jgi:hypothetical protein
MIVATVERQTPAEELPCTYYRRFTDGSVDIPKPPTQFTEEKWSIQSSPKIATAFQFLKKLCTANVLGYQLLMRGSLLTQARTTSGLEVCCARRQGARSSYYNRALPTEKRKCFYSTGVTQNYEEFGTIL